MTSTRLGLWAPGLNPSDPGVPGFISLDSPFLHLSITRALERSTLPDDSKIVIYAGALKAYTAAYGLVAAGISPHHITIVRPTATTMTRAGRGDLGVKAAGVEEAG